MIKTLATSVLIAGLAMPAISAGPDGQPEMQTKNPEALLGTMSQGRSYLGVDIQDVTSDRLSALKLKEERGVEVTMVDQDAPAGKAGVKEHDVILEFNGTRVESEEQLRRMIKETPPGRTVTLGVSREGSPMKISVQLADRGKVIAQSHPRWPDVVVPRTPEMRGFGNRIEIPNITIMQNYSRLLGIQGEGLTRQLGEFFGVKNGEGILVRSVDKGSPGEKAGVKAGDVIVKADDEKLTDRSDLSRILRSHREKGKINLGIVRDKREQTITVEVPQRGTKDSSRIYLDLDEIEPLEGAMDIEDSLEDLEPPLEMSRLLADNVRKELLGTLHEMKRQGPDVRRAMRDAQTELRKADKVMEKLKIELKKSFDPMI